MTATKESIRACADSLNLTMSAEFVPLSKSRNAGEKHKTLNWRVTLARNGCPFLTTDYSAGIAAAPSYGNHKTVDGAAALAYECEHGKTAKLYGPFGIVGKDPILPEFADVLYSLAMDSSALDHPTYETWADDYGFDRDSRKWEAMYRACLETALRLRAALGEDGFRALVTACEDY